MVGGGCEVIAEGLQFSVEVDVGPAGDGIIGGFHTGVNDYV